MRKFFEPYKIQFVSRKQYSHSKTLGAIPIHQFPSKLNLYTDILTQTAENCTAYSAVGERGAVTGKKYDPESQWKNELQYIGEKAAPNGVSLDDKMMTGVKIGFTPIDSSYQIDRSLSYFWVQKQSGQDWFDSIRSATLELFQKYNKMVPITIGVNWYDDWDHTPNGILTMFPKNLLGGHDIEIAGFETFNGSDYINLQGTWGMSFGDQGIFRVPRNVFNQYFEGYGAAYWSDDPTLKVSKLNALSSLYQNIIILFQRLIAQKSGFPPPVQQVSRIQEWAKAIQKAEGYFPGSVSFINNNPGNLKYTSLTASWGGTKANMGMDGGRFCSFANYDEGFKALCNFLILGADNQLLAFHQSRTLQKFTNMYAGNPPPSYIATICTELKVAKTIDISTLL